MLLTSFYLPENCVYGFLINSALFRDSPLLHYFIQTTLEWKKICCSRNYVYNTDIKKKDKKNNSYAHNLQGNLQSENFSHQDESTFPGRCLHGLELLWHSFSLLSSKHVPTKKIKSVWIKTYMIIFSSIKIGSSLKNIDVSS